MQIDFYKTKTESTALNKVLTDNFSITGSLRDECDILNPIIEFNFDNRLLSHNYAYIPAFNRYYYITGVKVVGKLVTLKMHVDVLMSHKDEIRSSYGHAIRSSNGNVYIPDDMACTTSKVDYQFKKLGAGFTADNKYVFIVGGN